MKETSITLNAKQPNCDLLFYSAMGHGYGTVMRKCCVEKQKSVWRPLVLITTFFFDIGIWRHRVDAAFLPPLKCLISLNSKTNIKKNNNKIITLFLMKKMVFACDYWSNRRRLVTSGLFTLWHSIIFEALRFEPNDF